MNRTLKHGIVLVGVVAALGAVGAGCLTRPVEHSDPSLKTNFTSVISNQAIDKIDLLFMVDNSASMGDKQELLAAAVPDMLNRLVSPNCVGASGAPTGQTANMGVCPAGSSPEFPPVHNMHIGIVTSSLGGRGGDQCSPDGHEPHEHGAERPQRRQGRAHQPRRRQRGGRSRREPQPHARLVSERVAEHGHGRGAAADPADRHGGYAWSDRHAHRRLHGHDHRRARARLRLRSAKRGVVPLPRSAGSVRLDLDHVEPRRAGRATTTSSCGSERTSCVRIRCSQSSS